MSDPQRVDFKSKGGKVIPLLLVGLMAAIGLIPIRVISASIELGAFWSIGIIACIVLALLVWGILAVLVSISAPYLIVTPNELRQPKTFKTIRHDIGPDTKIGRYTITRRLYTQETTTVAQRRVTRTQYVMQNGAGPLVPLASVTPQSDDVTALARAFEDVAGVKVEDLQVLPVDPARGTPSRPDVRHWQ